MRYTLFAPSLLLCPALLCPALLCQAMRAGEAAGPAFDATESRLARTRGRSVVTNGNAEVFQNVVIDAGKSVSLNSTLDYSAADSVAVTVLCDGCDSDAKSLATAGLSLHARWLLPGADVYSATEFRSATGFPYWDGGGVLFTAYGPQFQLTLRNKSSQAITLVHVTLFRRGVQSGS